MMIKSGFTGERALIIPTPVAEEWSKSSLGDLLRITDIGFYPRASSHFRKRTAAETMQYILIYCIDGEGTIQMGRQKFSIGKDQLIIIPKGIEHQYGSSDKNPWTIYWMHFDGKMASHYSEGLNKPIHISPTTESRIEERIQLFEEIFDTLRNGYSNNNLNYCISVLFHFLGSLSYLNAFRANNPENKNTSDLLDKSIHFMKENIHRQLGIKEIAAYSGLSVSHFTAIFQQKSGFTPIEYFKNLKIQQACHLLDFTDMRINQISSRLGFSDPLYFSRIFTKTMAISAKEYRKKKKG